MADKPKTKRPRSKPTARKRSESKTIGRPTKLTDEVAKTFLKAIAHGCYIETACNLVGVSRDTYYGWIERANKARAKSGKLTKVEQSLVEFSDSIKKTLAKSELRELEHIVVAGESQWQAAAWRLERRYPDRWGRTRHEVTGADGGPVAVANWAELVTAARNKAKK